MFYAYYIASLVYSTQSVKCADDQSKDGIAHTCPAASSLMR